MNGYIFLDAETDGLYGNTLSIAAFVTDENFNKTDVFYGATDIVKTEIREPWVKENVLPFLQNAHIIFENEDALLEAFWKFYCKNKKDRLCIADVPYPVECNVFLKCITKNIAERSLYSPFPLIDLASVLLAKGIDPNESRQKLADTDIVQHDALNDVLITTRIFKKIVMGE